MCRPWVQSSQHEKERKKKTEVMEGGMEGRRRKEDRIKFKSI
jgi:hypothetical protein